MLVTTLSAETPFEREFKQLRDQREKSVAAAVDPINRRYQASLEQLLRRATQGNDLDTAVKIRKEMGAPVSATAGSSSAKPDGEKKGKLSKKDIQSLLTNTTWTLVKGDTQGPWGTMEFREKGLVIFNKERFWSVTDKGKVIVEQYTLEFSEDYKSFKVVWGGSGELLGTLKDGAK